MSAKIKTFALKLGETLTKINDGCRQQNNE